jgi:hypothetical protein
MLLNKISLYECFFRTVLSEIHRWTTQDRFCKVDYIGRLSEILLNSISKSYSIFIMTYEK